MTLTSQIWGQLGRCNDMRVNPYYLETSYQWLKQFICLLEAVWMGYQPQPWHCGIIFTPQVTLTSQILSHFGMCNGIRVKPYAPETAYRWLKHFLYVYYGCMKWSEVDININHDIVASFSLLKWPWLPKSEANLAGVTIYKDAPIFPWDIIPMAKHFIYVYYGCTKWSEVDISLNHDIMASFPLHKWPWLPKSRANLAGVMV